MSQITWQASASKYAVKNNALIFKLFSDAEGDLTFYSMSQ